MGEVQHTKGQHKRRNISKMNGECRLHASAAETRVEQPAAQEDAAGAPRSVTTRQSYSAYTRSKIKKNEKEKKREN